MSKLSWLGKQLLTLLGVLGLSFFLLRVAPGDPAIHLLKSSADPTSTDTEKELARIRKRIGTDRPLFYCSLSPWSQDSTNWLNSVPRLQWHGSFNQFHLWFIGIINGNWGSSFKDGQPVGPMIYSAWKVSLPLAFSSVALGMAGGWLWGLWMAKSNLRRMREHFKLLLLSGYATPTYLLAVLLIATTQTIDILSSWPVSGLSSVDYSKDWPLHMQLIDFAKHLILPFICLSFPIFCFAARLVERQFEIESARIHVQTARSMGLSWNQSVNRWILPLVSIPFSAAGMSLMAGAIGGAVVVESIFNLPGIGRLSYQAALERNYPVLLGVVVSTAMFVQLTYIGLEELIHRLDPRKRKFNINYPESPPASSSILPALRAYIRRAL